MEQNENTSPPVKRGRGRPRKNPQVERGPIRPPSVKMRAAPNWETIDPTHTDTPDRLHIDRSMIPNGMDMMWVTSQCRGQDFGQHRGTFEKGGWTPVHQDDFDGQFDGKFMARGKDGEITVDGLTLMARPEHISQKARTRDRQRAAEQVYIKEQALTGGDMPISLDSQHKSALNTNKINKSYERMEIPE